jgi:hypothetical protein
MRENARIGFPHVHCLRNHDRGQITAYRQLLDLGLLELDLPVRDNPEAGGVLNVEIRCV